MNKIKYWGQIFLLIPYAIISLIPRNKEIWGFGSTFGRRFADNPRYLYQYLSEHREEGIRAIWFTKTDSIVKELNKMELECYKIPSIKGCFMAMRCGYYIFDNYTKDISFLLSAGAYKVNLWHGTGNKKINHDNEFDRIRHPKNVWEKIKTFPRRMSDEKPSHYVLATSDAMAKHFSSAFQVDSSHILIAGYPRNDVFLNQNENCFKMTKAEKAVVNEMKQCRLDNRKIVLYMPTFRDSEVMLKERLDMKKLNSFLENEEIQLYVKLHPKSKIFDLIHQYKLKNVSLLENNFDVYHCLAFVDVLVTDYSSIYSDVMLCNLPTVFFVYDEKEYISGTRSSYFPFSLSMPEWIAHDQQELGRCIKDILCSGGHLNDKQLENRTKYLNELWKYDDGYSCKRVFDEIKEKVK